MGPVAVSEGGSVPARERGSGAWLGSVRASSLARRASCDGMFDTALSESPALSDGARSWAVDFVNDVHQLDLGSLVWTLLAAAGAAGAPSTPRLFFSFAAAPDRLFVFGGSGDHQVAPAIAFPLHGKVRTESPAPCG